MRNSNENPLRPKPVGFRHALAAAAVLAACAPAATAKIAFTGYADMLATVDSSFRVRGPKSVLGTLPEKTIISRGFSLSRAGLFAATELDGNSRFLMDLTFSGIGKSVATTDLQYAYWEGALPWDLTGELGKITLPFGFYNRNRYYSFRRAELGAPFFQAGILGLPIADLGGALYRRFGPADGPGIEAAVYAVNGYGNVSGSSTSLRLPTVPGGLSLSSNLGSGNNNKDASFGGRLALADPNRGEAGVSYYRGAWDPDGRRMLQIAGAHLHLTPEKFDILVEYVHIHARGDEGMVAALGDSSWQTHGAFATVSRPLFPVLGRPLTGYAIGEVVASRRNGGGDGKEVLRGFGGGASYAVHEKLTLKADATWLYYQMPFMSQKALILDGYLARLAMVVTF